MVRTCFKWKRSNRQHSSNETIIHRTNKFVIFNSMAKILFFSIFADFLSSSRSLVHFHPVQLISALQPFTMHYYSTPAHRYGWQINEQRYTCTGIPSMLPIRLGIEYWVLRMKEANKNLKSNLMRLNQVIVILPLLFLPLERQAFVCNRLYEWWTCHERCFWKKLYDGYCAIGNSNRVRIVHISQFQIENYGYIISTLFSPLLSVKRLTLLKCRNSQSNKTDVKL